MAVTLLRTYDLSDYTCRYSNNTKQSVMLKESGKINSKTQSPSTRVDIDKLQLFAVTYVRRKRNSVRQLHLHSQI